MVSSNLAGPQGLKVLGVRRLISAAFINKI
jgi:hypothetical protein